MKHLFRIYQLFSLLNLDVVTGTIGFVYTAVAIFPVSIPTYQIFILSSTVWIIYTSDRLLDKYRNPHISTTRHHFQFSYRNASLVILLSLIAINLLLILINKPIKLIRGGIVLSAFMMFYLFIKQGLIFPKKSFLFKEIFIACGYSLGIMLLPFCNSDTWPYEWGILTGYIFLVALINVFVIGTFEKEQDLLFGEKSLIHIIPTRWLLTLCMCFAIIAVLLSTTLISFHIVSLALIPLPILLLLPLFFRESFLRHNYYRLWEDGMLMLPIPFLIINSFL